MSLKEYSANELENTLSAAFRLIGVFDYNIFDLSKVTVDSNNLEHASILLRGLFSWSAHISGYNDLLNKTIRVCVENKVDEHKLLFGLIPKDRVEFGTPNGRKFIDNIVNDFFGELVTPSLAILIERKLNEVLLYNKNIFCDGKNVHRFSVSISELYMTSYRTLKIEALDSNSESLGIAYTG